ncbi:hypothetical protein [Chitinibacter sp. S2-10]|uniref:hypothetical protein n=1 Tax=Chitinibacter sp. S2-10 TaxID=3373597 RepID=UPI003977CEAA
MNKYLMLTLLAVGLTACSSAPKPEIPSLRMAVQLSHEKALKAIRAGYAADAALLWQDALLRYQALDDWGGQGMARLGLAQSQYKLGEFEAAKQTLRVMPEQNLFATEHRSQASLQLAQLYLTEPQLARQHLALSEQLCAQPCRLQWSQSNLAAQIAVAEKDWEQVLRVSAAVLNGAPAEEKAERAHAYRLQAQALLMQQQAEAALPNIDSALVLDRELARPDWLLDDYRLRLAIAQNLGDAALLADCEQKIASLCAALACK